ncbi:MAG: DUF4184 family protein [Candidatus Thorarchaeota archaeon]|jgi:membrane-bound metal-dependent hydrolase YbcI (DUF457 family)
MPLTPLHYPLAHGLSKVGKKLSLPGLVVGAVLPDIEVPLMWIFFSDLPDHLVLHSLIGAATLGTFLAVIITWLIYPPIISTIFRVDRKRLKEAAGLSKMLVVSCLIGVLSHVLLDYPMHWFNPILWPWIDPFEVVGPLVLLFTPFGSISGTAFRMANLLTNVVMGVWWLLILAKYWGKDLWSNHWIGRSSVTQ